jgi:hypothetical protein
MTRWQVVTMVLIALVLASLACSAATPTPTAPPPLPTAAATSTIAATPTTAAATKAPASTPKPSATDTRAPTAKATTAASPAGVLFTDDFGSQKASEDKGWVFDVGENVDTAWAANKYIVSIKKQNWLGLNWPDGTYDNFGAEAEGLVTGGSYAEYGLVFRVSGDKDSRSYYIFGVTTEGKYYLQKKVNGQWADKDPVPATVSSYVKPKVKNTLGVLAQGNKISLYINSFLVKTVTDDTSTSGMAGIYASTGDNTSAQVTFNRFTVLTADKAKAEWGTTPAVDPTKQPAATATKSAGTGTGNGTFTIQNTFSGFCRVNLWGQKNAELSAEGNSTKSLSLSPGTYGAKITLGNGREGDLPNQFNLPAGGYCTIVCYEKSYGGPYCGQ